MVDNTQIEHYVHFPLCGNCLNAWDVIYKRVRYGASMFDIMKHCPYGGCDPDVWDYIDESTGWPLGWEPDAKHAHPGSVASYYYSVWWEQPVAAPYDDDVFHRRSEPDGGKAHPWQRNLDNLNRQAERLRALKKERKPVEPEWDEGPEYFEDDEEDLFSEADDDIW